MHPKNKHKKGYDFNALIQVFPSLAQYVYVNTYQKQTVDFSNPKAVKVLNTALLKKDYGIHFWEFPGGNLCPPIPSRVDYLYHIVDLLKETKIPDSFQQKKTVLDVGTGATLIYPLLGNAQFNWNFTATDCEKASIKNAKKILQKNKLTNHIDLRFQSNKENILTDVINSDDLFLASVCNPPFYASLEEALKVNQQKNKNLQLDKNKRNFSGTASELWYKGGEKAFLHNYLYQSSLFKEQCIWFTSLVSKKENVKSMENSLLKLGATTVKIIPMQHGNKITRIVAWSFK
jgi:23S rRNA (adenine1618-N6)-methyltransferase